ncbi:MAG: hypothetical protein LLG37_01895, partial [Spirochaetia bacterium]|nr:hypothetical protein [Spirochaetia bacterium]
MSGRLSGRFVSRKPAGEKSPPKITPGIILIAIAIFIYAINAAGLYPTAELHPLVEAVLYVAFFAAVFANEKVKEAFGPKFHSRVLYALFLVFLTVAGASGGVVSGLKWAPLIPAACFVFNRDFKNAAIITAASFFGFIHSIAAYTSADYFLYLSLLLGSVLFHLTSAVPHKDEGEGFKNIETQKESKHFKTVIYGLLESIFRLYHDVLKPVSIILFLRDDDGNLVHTISVSKKENMVDRYYSFGIKEGVVGAGLSKGTFFSFDARGVRMPYYTSMVPVISAATIPVVLNKMIGGIALDFERDIEGEKEALRERLKNLTEEVVGVMELFDINHKVITKEQRVSYLYEINGKLNLMDGKSGLIKKFFEEVRVFDVYSGYLAEYIPEENSFAVTESFNYPSSVAGVKFPARDNEILRYCMDSGKPVVVEEASKKNINLNMKRMNIERTLVSLLKNGDHIYGFIKLDKEKEYTFSEFEVKTLEMIFSRITIML